jgi:hypothetical protein
MHEGRYYVLFRCLVKCKEPGAECILRLTVADKYLMDCMRLYAIDTEQAGVPEGKRKDAQVAESARVPITSGLRFKLPGGAGHKGYVLLGDIVAPYNVEASKLGLVLACNKEIEEFTVAELEEVAEYADSYTPYKYGMIFRERLYVPGDTAFSLHIRLRKGGQVRSVAAKEEKKAPGKKEAPPEDKQNASSEEKALEKPRRIRTMLYEGDEMIYENYTYNHVTVPHVRLQKTVEEADNPKPLHSYILQCEFDLSEWPDCVKRTEDTAGLGWVLKIVSPSSVAVVRDTEKEDREQAIKDSWEEAQSGRADKAQKCRLKYIAEYKKAHGQELTPEEEAMLQGDEVPKKKEEEKKWGLAQQAAKKAGVKEVKKQAGKVAPAKREDEPEPLDLAKPLPDPKDHISAELKAYLEHSQKDRLIMVPDTKHKARTRTPEECEQIRQKHEAEIKQFEDYIKEHDAAAEKAKKSRQEVPSALFSGYRPSASTRSRSQWNSRNSPEATKPSSPNATSTRTSSPDAKPKKKNSPP